MPEDYSRAYEHHNEVGVDHAQDWDKKKQDYISLGLVPMRAWVVLDRMFDPNPQLNTKMETSAETEEQAA